MTNSNGLNSMELKNNITLGEYIFRRLRSCGTHSVFGVPGDFNLGLLEMMYPRTDENEEIELINWVGCCNELNAAYAADGYSRYTNKIGCLVTTFGVGEISALNGIVGAAAENVKVLNIVGVPPTHILESNQYNIHHSIPDLKNSNLGKPNYRAYCDIVLDNITTNVEFLQASDFRVQISNQVCNKIDQLIRNIFISSNPGYLFVPCDLSKAMVSSANLTLVPQINLELSLKTTKTSISDTLLADIVQEILTLLYAKKRPCILCDVLVDRYGCKNEVNNLISKLNIWNFTTMMGKSIIDEDNDYFMGTYMGSTSDPSVSKKIESCDLVLHFGIASNEMNTGCYSFNFNPNSTIVEIGKDYVKVSMHDGKISKIINDTILRDILQKVLTDVDSSKLSYSYDINVMSYSKEQAKSLEQQFDELDMVDMGKRKVTQNDLQLEIPKLFNKSDIVVIETGSFQFAVSDLPLPKELKLINQGFYLSIGMALPASLGVGIGMRDYPNCHLASPEESTYLPKLYLFEGDGAAQMTIQELSSLLRYQIPIEIFIWNNDGYTVERVFEGETRSYNDIMPWRWTSLLKVFGDHEEILSKSTIVTNINQLKEKIVDLKHIENKKIIELIEVNLGKMDIPKKLKNLVEQMKLRQEDKSSIE